MRRPVHEVFVHKFPGASFGVDFHQHVGVWIVARCGHDVVLRTVGVRKVDPFMHMASDNKLNIVLVLAQQLTTNQVGR